MKSYFILNGKTERDIWNEYRAEWLIHRDAVLAFMNKLGGVEVRTNHFGAPIAIRFERGVKRPDGFRKNEWGSSGAHLISMKGQTLFRDDLDAITTLFPKFPDHIPRTGFFDLEVVWADATTPVYFISKSDTAAFMNGYGGYREITEKEFNFRMALDEFSGEERHRANEVLQELAP